MSIIIKHQEQRLQDIKGQLNYVTTTLREHGKTMEAWERKEYEQVAEGYKNDIAQIEQALLNAAA